MQAYKIKGRIDQYGRLIITEPIELPPSRVEVIILQEEVEDVAETVNAKPDSQSKDKKSHVQYKTEFLREWLEQNSRPVPPDFDPEQARLEALEEKYL